jgi:WD40 repeat protein
MIMLRRCTTAGTPELAHGLKDHCEKVYPVKLSPLASRVPLVMLATVGVTCFLTGESTERPPAAVRCVLEGSASIFSMDMTSSSALVATCDTTGMVHLWHPETRPRRALAGLTAHAMCVAFAPDGATLAVGDANSTISIWDVASCEKKWSIAAQAQVVRALAFAPDGTALASGGNDKCVYLWDLASHRLKARLTGHTEKVTAVAFAPDGRTLVSGSQDGTIRCWNPVTSQLQWLIPAWLGHFAPSVLCARFSPDGKMLATTSHYDPVVRLWESATGRELESLRGTADSMISTAFSPDGATLVTGDSRGHLTLWDLESRRPQASWNAHGYRVMSVAYSADGRTLASTGDEKVKLWEISAVRGDRP